MVPDGHMSSLIPFWSHKVSTHRISPVDRNYDLTFTHNIQGQKTNAMLEVAAEYSVALLVNALGVHHPTCSSLLVRMALKWARLWDG